MKPQKAQYDGNITDLEMIKSELESMVDFLRLNLTTLLLVIQSLQSELTDRMNVDAISGRSSERNEGGGNQQHILPISYAEFNNL